MNLKQIQLPALPGGATVSGKLSACLRSIAALGVVLGAALATSGCLDRPVGTDQPRTTNVIVDNLRQSSVDKIDLLFVVDNSLSMADKQEILAKAVPDLVNRLVDPPCLDGDGNEVPKDQSTNECPANVAREFQPITNIHVGIVTSSLGGFGSQFDCVDGMKADVSHLLGSVPRENYQGPDFLRWCVGSALEESACMASAESTGDATNSPAQVFSTAFANQIQAAGEFGCGWEATLEAWYRFLIDPFPWREVVRQNCPFGGDMDRSCIGPSRDEQGRVYYDETILAQRKLFLRADSLLAIIMLTDENDCSFRADGQAWRLATTEVPDSSNQPVANKAYKGTTTCAVDPNSPCCHSCGAALEDGCPQGVDAMGNPLTTSGGVPLGEGCDPTRYPTTNELMGEPGDDARNLRCFNQKQRFGVDYLYPVERYINALKLNDICPFSDTLNPADCEPDQLVANPLFTDLTFEERRMADPAAQQILPRGQDLVFLAGIVGVPWQDLAVDPDAAELEYRQNRPSEDDTMFRIDWTLLLPAADGSPPRDPLMIEQTTPRSGTHPITGETIGGDVDNEINGHEWTIQTKDDLQYACIFPLEETVTCRPYAEVQELLDMGVEVESCDCTDYGEAEFNNPLCNDLSQHSAKAYPSVRQLEVLRGYGDNSIVASICPRNTTNENASDFGYRPAVAAIVDRLKEQLKDKCLPRQLEVRDDGTVPCRIVEARLTGGAGCEQGDARVAVQAEVDAAVRKRLLLTDNCESEADCQRFNLCEIQPIPPGTPDYDSCLTSENPSGDGWCYVDPGQGLGTEEQVEQCPATEKRKIRFAGAGAPAKGTVTFFACAGAPVLDSSEEAPAPEPASSEGDDGAAGESGMAGSDGM